MAEPTKEERSRRMGIHGRWEQDEAEWDRAFDRALAETSDQPPNGMTEEEIAEWRRQRGFPPEGKPRG